MSVLTPHEIPPTAAPPEPFRVALHQLEAVTWAGHRRGEPVTIGVPMPRGRVPATMPVALETASGDRRLVQTRVVDHWPDGSARWLRCDVTVDVDDGSVDRLALLVGAAGTAPGAIIEVAGSSGQVRVETGAGTFAFESGGVFPFSARRTGGEPTSCQLRLEIEGATLDATTTRVTVVHAGPLRAELDIEGQVGQRTGSSLALAARVELFAGSATSRVAVTLRNPRRAHHAGGQWGLGDAASVHISSAVLCVQTPAPVTGVRAALERGQTLDAHPHPFEIYQASSGGPSWNGPVHRNRRGEVALDFRGYRVQTPAGEGAGRQATPIVVADSAGGSIGVAVPEFWQQAPRAVTVTDTTVVIGFFPAAASDPQELQGGEQKTHRAVIAFGDDGVSVPPLAWCHAPLLLGVAPAWVHETGVLPYVLPAAEDPNRGYHALVEAALDPHHGFEAKRLQADEYGWRHFGDLPADHESAFQPPDRPFVSHYNNQYDAVAGFAIQFLRTGDVRWFRLMDELARHVRDIDIYHTDTDKAAYNGGLFWHTQHYQDAGLSTHRTYPPGGNSSGGPSAEHNYNAGLAWHYWLTGDEASRDAALGLGRWVLAMDDGDRTPFRWLARCATGLASFSADYYGPGRGAGHSILALLVAHRLTGDRAFLDKTDELIRRTIHPADDIASLTLDDWERRWSYTAFLQALGVYLHHKQELGEYDPMFAYARASLLRYAGWMADHEVPYLSRPERLEYPTETWAAQDLRKSEVFLWAACHVEGETRVRYLERADFFHHDSVNRLLAMPTHVFTRPTVLLLSFGCRKGWFDRMGPSLGAPAPCPPLDLRGWPPVHFVPQKAVALRRARVIVIVVAAAGLVAGVALLYLFSIL